MKTLLTKEYTYNGKVVEFVLNQDVMINATEMAAIFDNPNKRVSEFLKLVTTKKWIDWLEKSAIRANRSGESPLRFEENEDFKSGIKHRSGDLVPILIVQKGGDDGGVTWMHRLLAIEFAMWLDIDFKGWVILKIDQMLFNYSILKSSILLEKQALEDEESELYVKHANDPTVKRLIEINTRKSELKNSNTKVTRQFSKGLFD